MEAPVTSQRWMRLLYIGLVLGAVAGLTIWQYSEAFARCTSSC